MNRSLSAATYLGAWIVLLVVVIYGPVMIGALTDSSAVVQTEGISYFAGTLLFGGVILSLASRASDIHRRTEVSASTGVGAGPAVPS